MEDKDVKDRRPIRARQTFWAAWMARGLQRRGVTPNAISIASVFCAAIAALCLAMAFHFSQPWIRLTLLLLGICAIQARLLCNLLDGMVAVEGGLKTPEGAVFNDLPDRIADPLILLGVGYGLISFPWAVQLGWAAALLAVLTAYIRLLGASCGLPQRFLGPMAKQHRMALVTISGIAALFLSPIWGERVLLAALSIVAFGSFWTCWRRVSQILHELADRE